MSGENERLWQTLDIGNMFGPTLASKIHNNFNIRNNIMVFFFAILLISIFLCGKNSHCLILLKVW